MLYELELVDGVPATGPTKVIALPVPDEEYTLRLIVPATSPVVRDGVVRTNHPPRNADFDRTKYYDYSLGENTLSRDFHVDIPIHRSGAFSVYVDYTAVSGAYSKQVTEPARSKEWYFIVNCSFTMGKKQVGPTALCVQTVLPKLMGPFKAWNDKLAKISDKGYNMIHFVPLQPRGESDSPFSIYDQLSWDSAIFPNGDRDIAALVEDMATKHGMLAISDIVLNHTANNTPWLCDHPEAGYNRETAPYLEAAIELDNALLAYSKQLADEGARLATAEDLDKAVLGIPSNVFEKIRLWEYYVVDADSLEHTVAESPFEGRPPRDLPESLPDLADKLIDVGAENFGHFGPRFHRKINSTTLAEYVAATQFTARQLIDEVNARLYAEYDLDAAKILRQIKDRQRYTRLDEDGPKVGAEITSDYPLIESYFTRVTTSDGKGVELANNGWIWGGDPLTDFAGPDSRAYLVRDVVIWGDCVKLRYGSSINDSSFLWEHMAKYAKMLAKYFDGLRLDNCHSTPLHVGEYILDQARSIKSNLYVVAELFTGSEEMDKLFVEHLGITSLLREAIQPHSVQEFSTLVNVNGGLPVGSFVEDDVYSSSAKIRVRAQSIHAWFMECTHDNESFAQKRTVEDTLSTAGLVAMCQVSSGSAVGSDECYPKGLNIVSESRPYVFGTGITAAKRVLNHMHTELGEMNAFESYTHLEGQYITVHRLNPETGEGFFLIARTKFHSDGDQKLDDVFLEKTKAEWFHGWEILVPSQKITDPEDKIVPIDVEVRDLKPVEIDFDGTSTTIRSPTSESFPQGSVAILKTSRTFEVSKLEKLVRTDQHKVVQDLDFLALNVLMYHAEGEERSSTAGELGTYNIPEYGSLVYAGLQGWETLVRQIVANNDLGHPLCKNLRDGMWAFDSLVSRLKYFLTHGYATFDKVLEWLEERVDVIRNVPSYLRPRYFATLISGLYSAAAHRAVDLMPEALRETNFNRKLALTSIQMVAKLPNASLVYDKEVASMAAGLPHFSEGIMRCWGRDVFLSLGGLLLETHRYETAKDHICAFGATLYHGLVPNLLDSQRNPRYNARDAAWFFAQSVQDFCKHTNSVSILHEKVKRRFPKDGNFVEFDSLDAFSYETSVGQIVFEILATHARGIKFREHNAGSQIDMHMKDNGFNHDISVNWENGFIFGGNPDNCGTWMDKMGESERANSDGVPGTPRDGAAIEIVGLLKSCLRWVTEVREKGGFDFPESVKNQHGEDVKLTKWESLIQDNFERCFYVPLSGEDESQYDIVRNIMNRRGIYKDLYRSSKPYEDYQLRPNFAIAMVYAPELFKVEHAVHALKLSDKVLRGPIGMSTLDPSDHNYRPNYENSIDNEDFAVSKGRNYHQGPEWVWCEGVFLQALVLFDQIRHVPTEETTSTIRERIQTAVHWINTSPWAGLTELTNKGGALCGDSSPTQAWSSARFIEALAQLGRAK